jgi:hypothetical protein
MLNEIHARGVGNPLFNVTDAFPHCRRGTLIRQSTPPALYPYIIVSPSNLALTFRESSSSSISFLQSSFAISRRAT